MLGVARLAQVAHNVVGTPIDGDASDEDDGADDELRGRQPVGRVLVGKEEDPVALNETVHEVEEHAHQHDGDRHLVFALQQQREDERTVEVVELKQAEQHERYQFARTLGRQAQEQHNEKHRALHQHPGHFVVDGGSPFAAHHFAVAGFHEIERDEYDQSDGRYDA